jgi:hypothetical protein
MKKYRFLLTLMLVFSLVSCTHKPDTLLDEPNPEDINTEDPAVMAFESNEHDFGRIAIGDFVEYDFPFTNKGGSKLLIVDARADCGCTVAEYPKEPIMPGESSIIKVRFNTAGKEPGKFTKEIRLSANTYPETVTRLKIMGEIVGPGNQ